MSQSQFQEAIPLLRTGSLSSTYQHHYGEKWASITGALAQSEFMKGEYDNAATTTKRLISSELLDSSNLTDAQAFLGKIHSAHGFVLKKQGANQQAIPFLEEAVSSSEFQKNTKTFGKNP